MGTKFIKDIKVTEAVHTKLHSMKLKDKKFNSINDVIESLLKTK